MRLSPEWTRPPLSLPSALPQAQWLLYCLEGGYCKSICPPFCPLLHGAYCLASKGLQQMGSYALTPAPAESFRGMWCGMCMVFVLRLLHAFFCFAKGGVLYWQVLILVWEHVSLLFNTSAHTDVPYYPLGFNCRFVVTAVHQDLQCLLSLSTWRWPRRELHPAHPAVNGQVTHWRHATTTNTGECPSVIFYICGIHLPVDILVSSRDGKWHVINKMGYGQIVL